MLDKDRKRLYALYVSFLESNFEARWDWMVVSMQLFLVALYPPSRKKLADYFNEEIKKC